MEVVFLSSVQGFQTDREHAIVDRLRSERPDLQVRLVPAEDSAAMLVKYKLKFGPAVLIDNRLEFVGVPRYRMLLERIDLSKRRAQAPPAPAAAAPPPATAGGPGAPAPAAKPGPAKPPS